MKKRREPLSPGSYGRGLIDSADPVVGLREDQQERKEFEKQDEAFCAALRAAVRAGKERAAEGVVVDNDPRYTPVRHVVGQPLTDMRR